MSQLGRVKHDVYRVSQVAQQNAGGSYASVSKSELSKRHPVPVDTVVCASSRVFTWRKRWCGGGGVGRRHSLGRADSGANDIGGAWIRATIIGDARSLVMQFRRSLRGNGCSERQEIMCLRSSS